MCKEEMNEAKDCGTSLDRNMGPEMDLVNRPNPWLPAYGFQIQHHHTNFQQAHEDLRANETMLVQQVDFLETILEETSDDLQSDSDRSETTYWLGSDSENESVIHIKSTQRIIDDKQDGSGSECNSVVPKKRRRKNGSEASAGGSASSRDSSASSRSSSLLQFESLERTCATLSPSNYSFDSLEYGERRSARDGFLGNDVGCASPDSLEQDYRQFNGRLRPYRSFESLSEKEMLSNGFAAHTFAKDCDLSRLGDGIGPRGRDPWQLTDIDGYSDYSDRPVELRRHTSLSGQLSLSEDEDEDEELGSSRYSGIDQLLVFGDQSSSYSHTASLDCRNSVDLRDFGLDSDDEKSRRESTFLDLKATARLSLSSDDPDAGSKDDTEPSAQLRRRHHHHHHHHHHRRRRTRRSASGQLLQYAEARQSGDDGGGGVSVGVGFANDGGFNFRFSDKWHSAPSLPASLLESAANSSPSTSLLSYENYIRVSSVPADLDLCGQVDGGGTLTPDEDETRDRAPLKEIALANQLSGMAAIVSMRHQDEEDEGGVDGESDETARLRRRVPGSSVKTQDAQSAAMLAAATPGQPPKDESKGLATPTVKTQDRPESNVLELAMAMESDVEAVVDEAIRQLGREDLVAALESAQRIKLNLLMEANQEQRRRVKNNASYELAQQCAVDEKTLSRCRHDEDELSDESERPRRVLNSASYELAQQCEYARDLSPGWTKPFYRMDACEELTEPSSSSRSSRLKVSELVEDMSINGSSANLPNDSLDYPRESGTYARSMENVAHPYQQHHLHHHHQQQQLITETDTSLLGRLKKNSDFFLECGEGANRTPTPGSCVSGPDDELDYPSLLENKPIVLRGQNPEAELSSARADDIGTIRNRSLVDDFRPWSDFESVWSRGQIEKPAPVQSPEEEEAAVAATAAARRRTAAMVSPLRTPAAEPMGSVASAAGSSPAVDFAEARCGLGTELADQTSEVQPRAEMSATAAKRLAMSGEPTITRCGSAVTTVPLPILAPKEERKKSGLGGFLQRFSKLRFSGRSKVPRSEVQKKSAGGDRVMTNSRFLGKTQPDPSATRKKKEPDYIIVPLHPTEEETRREEQHLQAVEARGVDLERSTSNTSANGRPPVCSGKKPPLPPQYLRTSGVGVGAADVGVSAPSRRRAATDLGSPAAIEMAKARVAMLASQDRPQQQQQQRRQQQQQRPVGLLETDLDAPVDSEEAAASKKARSLLNLNHQHNGHHQCHHEHHLQHQQLGEELDDDVDHDGCCQQRAQRGACHLDHHRGKSGGDSTAGHQRPHKSMEFLLDKENLHFVQPPENELQKVGERVPSEHELRVQRSLQRLNVPDWYKNSPAAREGSGFRLKRHSDASQHGGWRALGSKTTSLSSLSSSSNRQPTPGTLLSPSPTPPVFSRWSTSLLNSAGSSPASSARSSFNHRQPYLGWRSQERLANPRTPAERLAQGILPQLQNANKQQQQQQQHQHQPQFHQQSQHQQQGTQQLSGNQTTNQEVRNSIKEVTSAIVHYVQSGQEVVGGGGRLSPRSRLDDWDERGGARSTSPRGSSRLVWMESSFVGVRPVDSPDTPVSIDVAPSGPVSSSHSSLLETTTTMTVTATTATMTMTTPTATRNTNASFRSTTTCEETTSEEGGSTPGIYPPSDLGSGFTSSPTDAPRSLFLDLAQSPQDDQQLHRHESPSPTQQQQHHHQSRNRYRAEGEQHHYRHYSHRHHQQQHQRAKAPQRRRSEGSLERGPRGHRRPSLDGPSGPDRSEERVVRCRNGKCSNSTSPAEARRVYKSCHNCSSLYCSRECRRSHWQRHRRTCLYSRASSLCVQVLSSVKRDPTSLGHVSTLARRGFLAHGRGAVRCFFASPEAAERFVAMGFQELGEPSYVRWSDILPSEMGAELYAEAVRLCDSYNPETRLVVYVSVCVVREVPSVGGGPVMWERQPVSRCAKLKLDGARKQLEEQHLEQQLPEQQQQQLNQELQLQSQQQEQGLQPHSQELQEQQQELQLQSQQQKQRLQPHSQELQEQQQELQLQSQELQLQSQQQRLQPHSQELQQQQQELQLQSQELQLQSQQQKQGLQPHSQELQQEQQEQQEHEQEQDQFCTDSQEMESSETLVLTSKPLASGAVTTTFVREIALNNIVRQLELRGILLHRQFPQVYGKLRAYADGSVEKFAPLTIYPKNKDTGRSFVCIIMLDAQPEYFELLPTNLTLLQTIDVGVEAECD